MTLCSWTLLGINQRLDLASRPWPLDDGSISSPPRAPLIRPTFPIFRLNSLNFRIFRTLQLLKILAGRIILYTTSELME